MLYLQQLRESTESKAAVEEAVHALSWLHGLAGLQPLGGSPLVKATLEGLRYILAKPWVWKEPVNVEGHGGGCWSSSIPHGGQVHVVGCVSCGFCRV